MVASHHEGKPMKNAFLVLLASLSYALPAHAKLSCTLSEAIGESKAEVQFEMPLTSDGRGTLDFSSLNGVKTRGDIRMENGTGIVRVLDNQSKRYFSASSKVGPGAYSRFLIVPPAQTADSVEIDCEDSEEIQIMPRRALDCLLTERAGATKIETPFRAPVAQNGHDVFALPKGKLLNFSGWVLGYQNVLVLFMMNPSQDASITSMGTISGPVSLSWYPTPQDIEVELRCESIPNILDPRIGSFRKP